MSSQQRLAELIKTEFQWLGLAVLAVYGLADLHMLDGECEPKQRVVDVSIGYDIASPFRQGASPAGLWNPELKMSVARSFIQTEDAVCGELVRRKQFKQATDHF